MDPGHGWKAMNKVYNVSSEATGLPTNNAYILSNPYYIIDSNYVIDSNKRVDNGHANVSLRPYF